MEHPKLLFVENLKSAVESVEGDATIRAEAINASVNFCDHRFGDFTSNIALKERHRNQNPKILAKKIAEKLKSSKILANIETAGPGFINVRLKPEIWARYVESIDHNFTRCQLGKGQSIQLEFVSANPTGPLVLTNAWQAYYGDILANIYAAAGYKVSREYYLNDGGNQITALGQAIQQALGMEFDEEIASNLYRGEYINDVAEIIVEEFGSVERVKNQHPSEIGKRASEIIMDKYIKPDLDRLGVKFDSIYSESKPDVKETLKQLHRIGITKKLQGAIWLDGVKVGLKQDEVLVRSYDKGYTYFLKDIAYQLDRLQKRGFDKTITIVGPDHHGQAIRLLKTLKALGQTNFSEISTQTIRLIKNGKEFKMSKRRGDYILLKDFLDAVPSEVARFYFAMRDTNTHMDFDLDLVREQSSKNPVYYALYAYARACSIEKKAKLAGKNIASSLVCYKLSSNEILLIKELSKIPLLLEEITINHRVHLLVHQILEVARLFHEFYESERIIDSKQVEQKLAILRHFKLAYESVFLLLGVSLLESM